MSNEVDSSQELSKDLQVNVAEIKTFQQIGGQAIFEIGRRLQHVHDELIPNRHGDWKKFLNIVGMNVNTGQKLIKIAKELSDSNYSTSNSLGIEALYMISTIPEVDRDKEFEVLSGESKKPTDMTVRELRQLKASLKEKDKLKAELEREIADKDDLLVDANDQIKSLKEAGVKEVEVTVEKEIVPDDYDDLKKMAANTDALQQQIKAISIERDNYQTQAQKIAEQRDRYAKNADEYSRAQEDLTAVQNKIKKLNRNAEAIKVVERYTDSGMELLEILAKIDIRSNIIFFDEDSPAIVSLEELCDEVGGFYRRLKDMLTHFDEVQDDTVTLIDVEENDE